MPVDLSSCRSIAPSSWEFCLRLLYQAPSDWANNMAKAGPNMFRLVPRQVMSERPDGFCRFQRRINTAVGL